MGCSTCEKDGEPESRLWLCFTFLAYHTTVSICVDGLITKVLTLLGTAFGGGTGVGSFSGARFFLLSGWAAFFVLFSAGLEFGASG